MLTPSPTYDDYAQQVVDGDILACEWVKKAAERHLSDLNRDWIYEFSPENALKAIKFMQLLPHVKGRWAANKQKIDLEPWQQFIIASIFGWVRKSDGMRRFREAYVKVPRKNGKSVLAAGIGLYCMMADDEYGAEVYSGATSEKQAWEVFRPVKLMAQKTPALLDHYGVEVNAKNLLRPADFSRFEPLIGNPGDGASPSCAIVDEYHEHDSSDLYDTMLTGMGARDRPLMFVITTAGSNIGGPCYEKELEARKVLDGVFDDDRFFSIMYGLDEEDDYKDPSMWRKANPNLGVSVSEDYLEAQVASAIRTPSRQNSVKTKHFNIWVGAKTAWLPMDTWAKCGDESLEESDFYGCPAYVGLDLASKIDVAARCTVFTKRIDDKTHYYAFPHMYLPEEALDKAKNASSYRGWSVSGHIEIMDGGEVSFDAIQEDIISLASKYPIKEIAYDPWQATQMAQNLRDAGALAIEYPHQVKYLSPAMKELEAALASGRFHHPDNPVLNWMASNVTARIDKKDELYPNKDAPENKIDGMIAVLMAIGRAMLAEDRGSLDDFLNNVVSI